jgi:hypothetical protein
MKENAGINYSLCLGFLGPFVLGVPGPWLFGFGEGLGMLGEGGGYSCVLLFMVHVD